MQVRSVHQIENLNLREVTFPISQRKSFFKKVLLTQGGSRWKLEKLELLSQLSRPPGVALPPQGPRASSFDDKSSFCFAEIQDLSGSFLKQSAVVEPDCEGEEKSPGADLTQWSINAQALNS